MRSLRAIPRPVLVVFGLGIALRVALTVAYRPIFAGYPDSEVFAQAAGGDLFASIYRTAGYPLFLRIVHLLSDELTSTTLVQHGLGVVSAGLLYAAARRAGAAVWPALLPAAVVLFGGTQLYLEHALLSESLFVLLTAAALWCAVRALDSRRVAAWLAPAALLLGAAVVVRPAGILLPLLLAGWAALLPAGSGARRALAVGIVVLASALPVGAYVVAQERETGFTGMARADGWTLYARVGEFADCSRFTPPAGTRRLCQDTPPVARESANSYLYEHAYSPALRVLGAAPAGNDELATFARRAILAQPYDYARTVVRDVIRAGSPNSWHRRGMGHQTPTLLPYLRDAAGEQRALGRIAAYWDTEGYKRGGMRRFDAYANATAIEGPLTAILALLAALGVALSRGPARRVAALFALAGLTLLVVPAATLFYDVRYATTAYPLLAVAAAVGGQALLTRARASA